MGFGFHRDDVGICTAGNRDAGQLDRPIRITEFEGTRRGRGRGQLHWYGLFLVDDTSTLCVRIRETRRRSLKYNTTPCIPFTPKIDRSHLALSTPPPLNEELEVIPKYQLLCEL
jgi:hypothetical protein